MCVYKINRQIASSSTLSLHPDPATELVATSGSHAIVRLLSVNASSFGEEKGSLDGRGKWGMAIQYVREMLLMPHGLRFDPPPFFFLYFYVLALAKSPDGHLLAMASDIGQVSLWDTAEASLIQSFAGRSLPSPFTPLSSTFEFFLIPRPVILLR
jgi:WD40 repeat protein